MGLLETLIGQPPNADVNADSDAFSSPDDAVDEEQGQFVQDFLQVFQLALNASPYFQAQMQPSESSSQVPFLVSFFFGKSNAIVFVFFGTCCFPSILSSIDRSGPAALSHRVLRHRLARSAPHDVSLRPGDPGADRGVKQHSLDD